MPEPLDSWYPAVAPPDSMRERVLAEIARYEALRAAVLAEVARLEALDVASLIGPWGEAARLKAIAEGSL